MHSLLEDVRYTFRALRLNPAFAAVAVLSLALGIGANTAIFSLIDAILLRPLAISDPGRLVFLSDRESSGVSIGTQRGVRSLFTYEEFEQLRTGLRPTMALCAAESNPARLHLRVDSGPTEEVRGKLVTRDYFTVLGISPVMGRLFSATEDAAPGSGPVALLAYDYWQARFNRDAAVLGRTMELNRQMFTIIGVLPPGFRGEVVGDAPSIFVPMSMEPQLKPGRFWLRDDANRAEKVMWLHVIGRLADGITMQKAQTQVDLVFRRHVEGQAAALADAQRRRETLDQRIELSAGAGGASILRARFAEPLAVLMAMVSLVLLIACANVANLLLARATARQREIALRLALGARRARVVRQLLTESVLLALLGGVLGVWLAYWSAQLLLRLASSGPAPIPLDLRPDARLLAFTAALSLVTGLVFGLVPALRATRISVNTTLKDSASNVTTGGSPLSVGRLLVIGQVAISVVLLVGAGLFVRTLANLGAADLGYAREGLLVVRVEPISAGYRGAARADVYRRLVERVRALPGVRSATISENGLFSGTESADQVTVEGFHSDKDEDNSARYDQAGPDYFTSVGIRMLLGRDIEAQDNESATRVCVVNEAFAKFYFGSANPLGKHVRDEFPDTRETFEIVGVADDARDHAVRGRVPRRFYVPFFQALGGETPASAYLTIRTVADPGSLVPMVRRGVADVDRTMPVLSASTLVDLVDRSVAQERMVSRLSTVFGGLALLLAAIGLYGTLSYSTARRTREFGIRMALGADGGMLRGRILRETLALVVVGLAVGVAAALAAGPLVRTSLFGLEPADPLSIGLALAVVVVVSLVAGYMPARRASRCDPLVALRCE